MSSHIALAALSAIFLLPLPAAAADDLARLRQELEQTKALVQQLEARLAAVEAQAAAGPPPGPPPAWRGSSPPDGAAACG